MEIEGLISVISLAGKGAFSSTVDSKIANDISGINRKAWIDLFNRMKNIESGKFIIRTNSFRRLNSMNLYGSKKQKSITLKVNNAIPEGVMISKHSELNRDTFRRLIWDWEIEYE